MSAKRRFQNLSKFPRYVFLCGTKNSCLAEPFFKLDMMLRPNEGNELETI